MTRRFLIALAAAMVFAFGMAAPASASAGAVTTSNGPAIACTGIAGNYCAKVFFTSTTGGVFVNATKSTGYTEGRGSGREWFAYTCSAGTCLTAPSGTFLYSTSHVQLNVTRPFGAGSSGFFLPCRAHFGVEYFNPATNAPDGLVQFTVTCH